MWIKGYKLSVLRSKSYEDLMFSMVTVNNTVLYTLKSLRVDLKDSHYQECVSYLDLGNSFTMYMYMKS